jgi:putative methionine-R-sulfoxide reductase with GAF domain/preprotein translocase subunit SecG
MISLFNDRYKINLLLAAIFVLGIGASLYFIYSLPQGLQLTRGYEAAFTKVYAVVGVTFLVGALTLLNALRYRKEIVVFRDRALEAAVARQEADQAGKTTISLDNVLTMLGQAKNVNDTLQLGLQAICKQLEVGQGAIYRVVEEDNKRKAVLQSGYALSIGESAVIKYELGEGLIGQAASNGNTLYVDDVPDGYVKIVSGLGSASPRYLLIVALKSQNQILGIIELASFTPINEDQRKFVEEAAQHIAEKISNQA